MLETDVPTIAWVKGQPYTELPHDLFIPPDHLSILLETFSGPLDLLLYLIRRQDFDIMDIPIVLITEQYIQYIGLMEKNRLELAPDYLVMAATLAEIKSKLLLPIVPHEEEVIEADPRRELAERLQAYAQFKYATEAIDVLPRIERDIFTAQISLETFYPEIAPPQVTLSQLISIWEQLIKRRELVVTHTVPKETFSTEERVDYILSMFKDLSYLNKQISFVALYKKEEGRIGIVVSLLAVLELCKQAVIEVSQEELFGPIYLTQARND